MNGLTKILLATLLLSFISFSCKNEKETSTNTSNTTTTSSTIGEWKVLFDGKNTDAWRGYNHPTFPTKGWRIESDGSLAVSKSGTEEAGFGGDIITKEKFENFELELDFMVSDTGNSGILYRVVEDKEMAIWQNAHEYQILDDETYIKMGGMDMNTHLTGDNYDLQSSSGKYSKPIGEWNTAKVIVNGNHIEHWLNGKKTVEFDIESPQWKALVAKSKFKEYPNFGRIAKGHIGLQDHGHLIKFRNIRIKELPSSFSSIYNGKNLDGWEIYGTEKWFVENGNLVCESGPDKQYGYLATNKTYKNFDLTLEFQQEADGNSGVFFRCSIEGTKITGWQSEVAPPGHDSGGIYESYGRGWLIKPNPELDKALKMGEWNEMRILVNEDHVTTWINGTQMVNFNDELIGKANGKIALQIHDGGGIKVKWRNLNIKEL